MSENQDRGARDYSRYDSMSTEQLQEILRLDAHRDGGVEMDTDELFYIMEVLTDRRKNDSNYTGKTAQQAYKTFLEEYMPREEEAAEPAKREGLPVWLRRVTAVAAVLAVFVLATVSVNAFGYDLWGKVAKWSADFFHFEDETLGTAMTEPDVENPVEYTSLQDALDEYHITQRLVPTWLPDGYNLENISIIDSPREISFSANYRKESELIISIRQLVGGNPEQVEKSENLLEIYDSNGVSYYIFSNNGTIQATWVVEEYEGLIIGKITIEEMKAIIDSI